MIWDILGADDDSFESLERMGGSRQFFRLDVFSSQPPGPIRSNSQDRILRWLAAFLITAIFCALQIRQSIAQGQLALPTTYDAISYYSEGIRFLTAFYAYGFRGIYQQYMLNPGHSPMSNYLAMLGFTLLGVRPTAGMAANGLVLFFFVRGFLAAASRLLLDQAVLLSIALMGFPLVSLTLLDFRPDMICGLLIAAGTLFIILRPNWLYDHRDQIIAGMLFGAALWAKPSVVHLTSTIFVFAIMLASIRPLRDGNLRAPIIASLVTICIGVLIALPYYLIMYQHIIDYIWTTAFGAEASLWVRPLPWRDSALYYLTGPEGVQSLGSWLYGGIAVCLAALLVLWRCGDRRALYAALLAGALLAASYLAVTIPSFKGPHGLTFAALFLATTAVAAVAMVKRLPRALGWAACIALVWFSAWQFDWPNNRTGIVSPAYAESRWRLIREAMQEMGNQTDTMTYYQTTPMVYFNYSIIAFEYNEKGLPAPQVTNVDKVGDLAQHRRLIEQANVVVAVSPDAKDVISPLPTATSDFRAAIIKIVQDSGLFGPPIYLPDAVHPEVILYKAKHPR